MVHTKPQHPISHMISRANNQYSKVCCVAGVFRILFPVSRLIMSTKHPSVSPASGVKQKAAITLETKLKVTAQL